MKNPTNTVEQTKANCGNPMCTCNTCSCGTTCMVGVCQCGCTCCK